jgi:hypothetical protein
MRRVITERLLGERLAALPDDEGEIADRAASSVACRMGRIGR